MNGDSGPPPAFATVARRGVDVDFRAPRDDVPPLPDQVHPQCRRHVRAQHRRQRRQRVPVEGGPRPGLGHPGDDAPAVADAVLCADSRDGGRAVERQPPELVGGERPAVQRRGLERPPPPSPPAAVVVGGRRRAVGEGRFACRRPARLGRPDQSLDGRAYGVRGRRRRRRGGRRRRDRRRRRRIRTTAAAGGGGRTPLDVGKRLVDFRRGVRWGDVGGGDRSRHWAAGRRRRRRDFVGRAGGRRGSHGRELDRGGAVTVAARGVVGRRRAGDLIDDFGAGAE